VPVVGDPWDTVGAFNKALAKYRRVGSWLENCEAVRDFIANVYRYLPTRHVTVRIEPSPDLEELLKANPTPHEARMQELDAQHEAIDYMLPRCREIARTHNVSMAEAVKYVAAEAKATKAIVLTAEAIADSRKHSRKHRVRVAPFQFMTQRAKS
jgi:hypothetical protein